MAWENLPMRDRATIIRLGVQSGLRDINSIKETYNKFADGGEVNRKLKWDKAIKGRKITTTYGENYLAGDDTMGLFQQTDDNSWTPVSVEQARDIYVPNVKDPVSNSYTQLGPMPTLTVTSHDWETVPYNVEDTRFGGRTLITTINVRRNKNTGKILPEDYRQALAIKDWYAKQHPKSDPSENALNDAVFTALTLGANKNLETTAKGVSSLVSKVDPVVKTSFREGIAKPMLLGSLVDQTQKAVTGTSLSDQIGSWLTNNYSWNPYVAHFVGDLTNPGYTMSVNSGNLLTKGIKGLVGDRATEGLSLTPYNRFASILENQRPLFSLYRNVPTKEGKQLMLIGDNAKVNFDPNKPISNSEFYYPLRLPFTKEPFAYKEMPFAEGAFLYQNPLLYFSYNMLTKGQKTRLFEILHRSSQGNHTGLNTETFLRVLNHPLSYRKVLNYLLTGHKSGNKQDWGYLPLNEGDSFNATSKMYTGFINDKTGADYTDALFYGTDIKHPALTKVATGKDFGLHDSYIREAYSDKAGNIPVYEITKEAAPRSTGFAGMTGSQTQPLDLPVSFVDNLPHIDRGVNSSFVLDEANDVYLDVAGHISRYNPLTGTFYSQDIFKYNPDEYFRRWLHPYANDLSGAFKNEGLGLKLYGAKELNRLTTPIITRTKVYGDKFGPEGLQELYNNMDWVAKTIGDNSDVPAEYTIQGIADYLGHMPLGTKISFNNMIDLKAFYDDIVAKYGLITDGINIWRAQENPITAMFKTVPNKKVFSLTKGTD